ncbi:MAG: nucleotidyl transferase AbiEii/AbiGii toxin family protein [bacterium]
MVNSNEKTKKNRGESVRQKLKNLSKKRNRPFDEILRYYAMERFLYRLSVSPYAERFFLKGGLMLKVWDSEDHRATMDIDLLARTSNKIDNLKNIIQEVSSIENTEDAIQFNTQNLILRESQTGGDYQGVSASYSANLFKTRIPVLIDIGFNDIIVPNPNRIQFPTLLEMPKPCLLGYTPETVVAEKLESIVKLGIINTRMKDFYDLWTIFRQGGLDQDKLASAIETVFRIRGTKLENPKAFTSSFPNNHATIKRWQNFLSGIGKESIDFKEVVSEISANLKPFISVEIS